MRALSKLALLQGVESAHEVASGTDKKSQQIRDKSALETTLRWLAVLPSESDLSSLDSLFVSPLTGLSLESSGTSMQRCLVREVARGNLEP
jgi:hypothetical protein